MQHVLMHFIASFILKNIQQLEQIQKQGKYPKNKHFKKLNFLKLLLHDCSFSLPQQRRIIPAVV